jgi:hypothetical protein
MSILVIVERQVASQQLECHDASGPHIRFLKHHIVKIALS